MLKAGSVEQFERACEYLMQLETRKTVNREFTSYGLKHRAEEHCCQRTGRGYVTNGMLLAAAYHLGLKVQRASRDSLNGYVNVRSQSLKAPTRPPTLPPKVEGQPFRILGHNQGTYFYWQDEQERVVRLPGMSHTSKNLLRLAPLEYWASRYPSPNKRTHFNR